MNKIILIIFIFLYSVLYSAEMKITYISSENVYFDKGFKEGVSENLIINKNIKITDVTGHSSMGCLIDENNNCIFDKFKLIQSYKLNDVFIVDLSSVNPIITPKTAKIVNFEVNESERNDFLQLANPFQTIYFNQTKENIVDIKNDKPKISLTINLLNFETVNLQKRKYFSTKTVAQINNQIEANNYKFGLFTDGNYHLNKGEIDESYYNIYELYYTQKYKKFYASFGRHFVESFTQAGAFDGISLGYKNNSIDAGILSGFESDYEKYNPNTDLFKSGTYFAYNSKVISSSFGIVREYFNPDETITDEFNPPLPDNSGSYYHNRTYLLTQHSLNISDKFFVYYYGEFNFLPSYFVDENYYFTNNLINIIYKPINKLSLSVSYDTRKFIPTLSNTYMYNKLELIDLNTTYYLKSDIKYLFDNTHSIGFYVTKRFEPSFKHEFIDDNSLISNLWYGNNSFPYYQKVRYTNIYSTVENTNMIQYLMDYAYNDKMSFSFYDIIDVQYMRKMDYFNIFNTFEFDVSYKVFGNYHIYSYIMHEIGLSPSKKKLQEHFITFGFLFGYRY